MRVLFTWCAHSITHVKALPLKIYVVLRTYFYTPQSLSWVEYRKQIELSTDLNWMNTHETDPFIREAQQPLNKMLWLRITGIGISSTVSFGAWCRHWHWSLAQLRIHHISKISCRMKIIEKTSTSISALAFRNEVSIRARHGQNNAYMITWPPMQHAYELSEY